MYFTQENILVRKMYKSHCFDTAKRATNHDLFLSLNRKGKFNTFSAAFREIPILHNSSRYSAFGPLHLRFKPDTFLPGVLCATSDCGLCASPDPDARDKAIAWAIISSSAILNSERHVTTFSWIGVLDRISRRTLRRGDRTCERLSFPDMFFLPQHKQSHSTGSYSKVLLSVRRFLLVKVALPCLNSKAFKIRYNRPYS